MEISRNPKFRPRRAMRIHFADNARQAPMGCGGANVPK
jgi:hypothetical protein